MAGRFGGRVGRELRRDPGFTLPAGGTLALAAAAAAAMLAIVHAVVLRPLPYPSADRLVLLCERHETVQGFCIGSVPNVLDLAESDALDAAGLARGWSFALDIDGERVSAVTGLATRGFFDALGVRPLLGTLPGADAVGPLAGREVVVSHGVWTRALQGDSGAVGRDVLLDGEPHRVAAVLPPGFEPPDVLGLGGIELWRPLIQDPTDPEMRGWRGFLAVARLAPDVDPGRAEAELVAGYSGLAGEHPDALAGWTLEIEPLLDQVVGDTARTLWIFAGAVALLVLIGASNLLGLTLVRAIRRRRDWAVRAALGAEGADRVRHALRTGLVLGTVSGGVAAGLAWALVRGVVALAPPGVPRLDEISALWPAPPLALGLGLVLGIAMLTLPALGSGGSWGDALRSGRGALESKRSTRTRTALVGAQMALSLVLLGAAAALGRGFLAWSDWSPGFDTEGAYVFFATASTGDHPGAADVAAAWRGLETDLAAIPGVRAVATVSAGPLFGGRETTEVEAPGGTVVGRWYDAGPGYFAALGLPLLRGREFTEADDRGAPPVVIVNEMLARRVFGEADPLDRTISLADGAGTLRVVGVVPDVPPITPGQEAEPELWWAGRQRPRWGTQVLLRTDGPRPGLAREVAAAMAGRPSLSAGTPRGLTELRDRALVRPRFQLLLMGLFAGLATLLAAGGLYALVSFVTAQRMREMGLRVALGARRGAVARRVLGGASLLVLMGVGVGFPLALGTLAVLSRTVEGLPDPGAAPLAVAAGALALAGLLASLAPARRAARVDPRQLLRD